MSEDGNGVNCFCGTAARLRTSWTDANPGRRFHACAIRNGGCAFFSWEDPPLCTRARIIIPGLLRRLNRMEIVNAGLRRRNKIMWVVLVLSWAFLILKLLI